MGTSSGGRGGNGSGMRIGGETGSYVSSDGTMTSQSYEPKDISNEIGELLKQLFARATTYTREMFSNSYLNDIYLELFTFSALVRDQNSVVAIGARYDLNMEEPGFIFNLLNVLDNKYRRPEVDSRCTVALRQTIEHCLFTSVRDNSDLVFEGSGRDVIAEMRVNRDFWKSLSGHFLANLAISMYKQEVERKNIRATIIAEKDIERRTNQVLSSYKMQFGEERVDYRRLFQFIPQHWEWFKKEMTR